MVPPCCWKAFAASVRSSSTTLSRVTGRDLTKCQPSVPSCFTHPQTPTEVHTPAIFTDRKRNRNLLSCPLIHTHTHTISATGCAAFPPLVWFTVHWTSEMVFILRREKHSSALTFTLKEHVIKSSCFSVFNCCAFLVHPLEGSVCL